MEGAEHIARKKDNRWIKRILEWRPRTDRRSRGTPPPRWSHDIKRKSMNWMARAQTKILEKPRGGLCLAVNETRLYDDDDDVDDEREIVQFETAKNLYSS